MCGIAGKCWFSDRSVTEKELSVMGSAISHRGPDDHGTYLSPDKKVGLSFRRLAIIDLSKKGHQPMSYLNRYWIIFNGEIYNYQPLRNQLEKEGYKFRSQTDTEVIVALYDRYQARAVEKLRGMFALAIYDEKEKILFCARDRLGKKPFKYFLDKNVFIFASELKSILTQKEYKRAPDWEAIDQYLTFQYVPAPKTGFAGIKKLLPGHWLRIDLKTSQIEIQRYWRLDFSHKLDLTVNEWKSQILKKFEESVSLRMISDVPLGAFLSGGIDSSAVVAMMSRHSTSPVKTFSIGFKEERFSELKYARIIAKKFMTDHTEFIVEPESVEILPLLVRQFEEPFADSSALPTYQVSKLTREHVTVALNGDGGDENFAGYPRYSIQKFALQYGALGPLNNLLGKPGAALAKRILNNTLAVRAQLFSSTLGQDYRRRYVNYLSYFSRFDKQDLYSSEYAAKIKGLNSEDMMVAWFNSAKTTDKLDQTLFADISSYLPDDLLTKVDIAAMSVSLEGRSPFLDHEFMELTAQMPSSLKLKGFTDKKHILKEAFRGILPDEIMFRKKMGFSVPVDDWFRGSLNGYLRKILLSSKLETREIFRREAIENLIQCHERTNTNVGNKLWALLCLELWFEEYFD